MKVPNYKVIIETAVMGFILVILLGLTILFAVAVDDLNGTARVVNYTGIVRGATQRVVKLEISNNPNDGLIRYIDDILMGLQNSSETYNLVKIEDKQYQDNLIKLDIAWDELKGEMYHTREAGYFNTEIIDVSEKHFKLADEAVYSVEVYSDKLVKRIERIEIAIFIIILTLIMYIVIKIRNTYKLHSINEELKNKAYIDMYTMLPNRSKCLELLEDRSVITKPTAVMIFDINGIELINDKLGHVTGDAWIQKFASIIRAKIPAKHFIGRYGGDEFIAVLQNITESQIDDILVGINKSLGTFNKTNNVLKLEYSYGYALSIDSQGCTLEGLLRKADKYMLEQKKLNKNEEVQ